MTPLFPVSGRLRAASRLWLWLILVAGLLAAFLVLPSTASAVRDFTPRFSTNDAGAIVIAANTLLTCPPSAGCTAAQNGGASNNNSFAMEYVDVDSDPTTDNSSTATLSLPSGATVLFAGLYWGAVSTDAARGTVLFEVPGSVGYQTVTAASPVDTGTGGSIATYQGFADVTSIVQAAGAGDYTVADVQALTGGGRHASWALVVVYRDASEPARNLTVFDGFVQVTGAPVEFDVSGFLTPPTGPVATNLGFVAYEGDLGTAGDTAALNGVALSDPVKPANNSFNSVISRDGVHVTAKNPNYVNQLGFDAFTMNAPAGSVGNNQTDATFSLTTSGDVYFPGVVTFATELFAPQVEASKSVVDVNGGNVEPGDVLDYTVTLTNNGGDAAADVVVRDTIPSGTTYATGSLEIDAVGKTDAAGDDEAEFLSGANQAVWRVGTGASATAGGTLGPSASVTVSFSVTVNAGIADGTEITNRAVASFFAQTLGSPLQTDADVSTPVAAPDLVIAKTHTGTLAAGGSATFSIVVSNTGGGSSQETVTVMDTLPAELSFDGNPSGTGWSCPAPVGQTFTCTRPDTLAPGGSYPAIVVPVTVSATPPATIANTAEVSGGGDGDLTNNTSTDVAGVTTDADLAIEKTISPEVAAVGEQVTFTLLVSNNGPAAATGVDVTDSLPAGLALVSATPSQGTCDTAVNCALGTIAIGGSATVTIAVEPQDAAAASVVSNTATVAAAGPDPVAGNNSSSADLTVTPTADLSLTKTVTPATATAGGVVTFTVTAANDGPSAAENVVVRDLLPAIGSFVSASPSVGTFDSATGIWTIGTLGASSNAALTFDWAIPAGSSGGTVVNAANVRSDTRDPDSSNDSASVSAPIEGAADLALTKTVDPAAATPGQTVTFTLVVTNNGPSAAADATIQDTLPAGLTFVSSPDGCTAVSEAVTCTGGALAAGASATFHVDALVGDVEGPLSNGASVSSTTPDPTSGNNTGSATVTAGPPASADLQLTKTVDPATAGPGDTVTFTLVVINNGPGAAAGATIQDTLPTGLTFASSPDGCTAAAQVVTCAAGDLAVGQTQTFHVLAVVGDLEGPVANSASVSSATPDPTSGNGTASATVTVGAPPPAQPPQLGVPSPEQTTGPATGPEEPIEEPAAPPTGGGDGGPATGLPRVPDLRGTVSASWDGSTLHVVLRIRVVRPKLVTGPVAVHLSIANVLDRTIRIATNGRARIMRSIEIPATALTANPYGARLVARIDPGRNVTEFRERNNTLSTRVL